MSKYMLNDFIEVVDNQCSVRVPYNTAMDFARYFIKHGIPVNYTCHGEGGYDRKIMFDHNTENANVMIAWFNRWHDGHEYCPFCGGLGEVYTHDNTSHIRCTKCGCMTKSVYAWREDEYLWEMWDKRAGKR